MRTAQLLKAGALLAVVLCSLPGPASQAQTCVEPATLCDQWWDQQTSKYIQNPTCAFINHAFLQSSTPAGSSEGYVYTPNGASCGVEETGVPCGVKTTTNTCAEGNPIYYCDPSSDPSCPACDPFDPNCSGGGTGPACDPEHPCDDAVGTELQQATLASPLPRSVGTLLEELARADAIYIRGKVTFTNSASATTSTGAYEYWERDGRYRVRIDPAIGYPWSDIAFDGRVLQGKSSADTVEVTRGDRRLTPLPDGPLALALAPLRVNNPATCRLCQLRLADLKKASAWRREAATRLAAAEDAAQAGAFDAGRGRTGFAAGGSLTRLVWPADKAQHRLAITLDQYQRIPGTEAAFPMKLTASLTSTVSVEYTLERVDLSPAFPDEIFNISDAAARIITTDVARGGSVSRRLLRNLPGPAPVTACTTRPSSKDANAPPPVKP